jgi:hypothetical protein
LIRGKLVLKYKNDWMPEAIYKACLHELVIQPESGVRARVKGNKLLLFFKGGKPSKVAERMRNILGLIHTLEGAELLLESLEKA